MGENMYKPIFQYTDLLQSYLHIALDVSYTLSTAFTTRTDTAYGMNEIQKYTKI